mmetsp:Transcript_3029/g.9066  ORF Transcript_3029/g.9066 Transcript_3029/m.9066 type:complete len:89 (+) Transcript_3029:288-554(+)
MRIQMLSASATRMTETTGSSRSTLLRTWSSKGVVGAHGMATSTKALLQKTLHPEVCKGDDKADKADKVLTLTSFTSHFSRPQTRAKLQ